MAVAVYQGFSGDRAEWQSQVTGLGLANQKLFEQKRLRADAFRGRVGTQRKQLVAQRQQTTRLQSDDGHAALGKWGVGRDQTIKLGAGVVDQASREKGPAAA